MCHSWRIIPTNLGNYVALIDGVDNGRLMATEIHDAVLEVKQMIEEMVKAGQK
jgi:hypothetical protein